MNFKHATSSHAFAEGMIPVFLILEFSAWGCLEDEEQSLQRPCHQFWTLSVGPRRSLGFGSGDHINHCWLAIAMNKDDEGRRNILRWRRYSPSSVWPVSLWRAMPVFWGIHGRTAISLIYLWRGFFPIWVGSFLIWLGRVRKSTQVSTKPILWHWDRI